MNNDGGKGGKGEGGGGGEGRGGKKDEDDIYYGNSGLSIRFN